MTDPRKEKTSQLSLETRWCLLFAGKCREECGNNPVQTTYCSILSTVSAHWLHLSTTWRRLEDQDLKLLLAQVSEEGNLISTLSTEPPGLDGRIWCRNESPILHRSTSPWPPHLGLAIPKLQQADSDLASLHVHSKPVSPCVCVVNALRTVLFGTLKLLLPRTRWQSMLHTHPHRVSRVVAHSIPRSQCLGTHNQQRLLDSSFAFCAVDGIAQVVQPAHDTMDEWLPNALGLVFPVFCALVGPRLAKGSTISLAATPQCGNRSSRLSMHPPRKRV
ncbi:hypothetical protein BD289DRAFT_428045 [Coniella lustricola]|uniref:Uncharacterized protein n=1 Tax=Coniella lustricola TaxID=2025994 RepID=A0A2T3AEP7_9PEZI|nr:hypothetical protein BD289DRAFT_428045 [Coniella lustricola]